MSFKLLGNSFISECPFKSALHPISRLLSFAFSLVHEPLADSLPHHLISASLLQLPLKVLLDLFLNISKTSICILHCFFAQPGSAFIELFSKYLFILLK